MILNVIDLTVRTREHMRRVDSANRDGWLRASTSSGRQMAKSGSVIGGLVALLRRTPAVRTSDGTTADDAASGTGSFSQGVA